MYTYLQYITMVLNCLLPVYKINSPIEYEGEMKLKIVCKIDNGARYLIRIEMNVC